MPREKTRPIRLGKREFVYDTRTLRLGDILAPPSTVRVPTTWDFDAHRAKLPLGLWGNDEYGNCVLVGRANHLVRNQRIETRRTLPITTPHVVNRYKEMTGTQSPGDDHDVGLVVIDALKDWRSGWQLQFGKKTTNYRITAFGSLDTLDREELRSAAWLLNGVQFGLWLPDTAKDQWRKGQAWDDVGTNEPAAQPGSWGGHLVYAKHFDPDGFYVITWGEEHYVTNRFLARYCDEAWAVVDALEGKSRYLDVDKMLRHLHDVGAHVIA